MASQEESEQLAKLRAMVEAKKLDEKSPLPLDDFMLRRFIIVKKTADKAFHTLKNYVGFLNDIDWNMAWAELENEYKQPYAANPYPYPRAHDGSTVLCNNTDGYEPGRIGTMKILTILWLYIETAQKTEEAQRKGITIMISVKSASLKNWHVSTQKKALHLIQNAVPMRLKSCILVHSNFLLRMGWNIVKTWMSDKVRERIHILNGAEHKDVNKFIDPALLPSDYGGTGKYRQDEVMADVRAHWEMLQATVKERRKAQR